MKEDSPKEWMGPEEGDQPKRKVMEGFRNLLSGGVLSFYE